MSNLIVDIGNTTTKVGIFVKDKLIHHQKSASFSTEEFSFLIDSFAVEQLIISTVKKNIGFEISETPPIKKIFFDHQTPIPLNNLYESPESLGLDRLAAVIGARFIYPNAELLVIDAGTCITYDFVNEKDEYYGGSISPGLMMRLRAMHHFTSKLPLFDLETPEISISPIAGNTKDAMLSGVLNGAYYEAKGFVENAWMNNSELKIILCGGDAAFFDSRFKNSIFANLISHEPHLVLIGLNTVLNYQNDLR